MLDTLKAIIIDFQENRLETGVPRRLAIEPVRGKATVCIGVRRSGKSTYLFQIIQRLQERGVPRQNILYLNFFDDRLHSLGDRVMVIGGDRNLLFDVSARPGKLPRTLHKFTVSVSQ